MNETAFILGWVCSGLLKRVVSKCLIRVNFKSDRCEFIILCLTSIDDAGVCSCLVC